MTPTTTITPSTTMPSDPRPIPERPDVVAAWARRDEAAAAYVQAQHRMWENDQTLGLGAWGSAPTAASRIEVIRAKADRNRILEQHAQAEVDAIEADEAYRRLIDVLQAPLRVERSEERKSLLRHVLDAGDALAAAQGTLQAFDEETVRLLGGGVPADLPFPMFSVEPGREGRAELARRMFADQV